MNFTIRPFEPRDFAGVNAVEQEGIDLPWTTEKVKTCLNTPSTFCLVGERQRAVRGFSIVEMADDKAAILRLVVHPKYRRKGLGTLLLDSVKSRLGGTSLIATSLDYQVDLQKWLNRRGFRASQIYRAEGPEDLDWYLFEWVAETATTKE